MGCHTDGFATPSRLFGWERLCTTVCVYAYAVLSLGIKIPLYEYAETRLIGTLFSQVCAANRRYMPLHPIMMNCTHQLIAGSSMRLPPHSLHLHLLSSATVFRRFSVLLTYFAAIAVGLLPYNAK